MDNYLNSKIGRVIGAKDEADEKDKKQAVSKVNFLKMYKWLAATHSIIKGTRKNSRVNKRPVKELRMPVIGGQLPVL